MNPWTGKSENFIEGELILIDKPYRWTSFDVVKKVRYLIRQKYDLKKIKVGHAGTLDPLATGLLIICTGKFTKRIDELMGMIKVYSGTIKLGETTPSFDLEQRVDQTFETEHITEELMSVATQNLTGPIQQLPPVFSAKKVDGKRAYEYARKREDVELKSREVIIDRFEIETSEFPLIDFNIQCSKGTYIRSMARDFGTALDSGGHLTALRRESIGEYSANQSITPEQFEELLSLC